jgi:hypothetical protein
MDEVSQALLTSLEDDIRIEETKALDSFIRAHAKRYNFPAAAASVIEAIFGNRLALE